MGLTPGTVAQSSKENKSKDRVKGKREEHAKSKGKRKDNGKSSPKGKGKERARHRAAKEAREDSRTEPKVGGMQKANVALRLCAIYAGTAPHFEV